MDPEGRIADAIAIDIIGKGIVPVRQSPQCGTDGAF